MRKKPNSGLLLLFAAPLLVFVPLLWPHAGGIPHDRRIEQTVMGWVQALFLLGAVGSGLSLLVRSFWGITAREITRLFTFLILLILVLLLGGFTLVAMALSATYHPLAGGFPTFLPRRFHTSNVL